MLKSNAHQKVLTSRPGTIHATSIIIKALITKVNKPKVKMLIGNVKMISKGLINVLIRPNTKAETSAAHTPEMTTPESK